MNIQLHNIARALIVAAAAALHGHAAGGVIGEDPRLDDRVIVHVNGVSTLQEFIDAFVARHTDLISMAIIDDDLASRRMYLLEPQFDGPPPVGLIDILAADIEANYGHLLISGEFLYENQAPEGKSGSIWVDGLPDGEVGFLEQYAAPKIRLEVAHARTTGLGVVVAVLDTGIDASHPRLADRVLPIGYDFIDDDDDPNDVGNRKDDDGDGDIDEMTGHGTFVAGLISLTAPDARLLPVRLLNSDGVGDGWLLTKGLAYVIDRGVEVINLSLSSTYNTATVEWMIEEEAEMHGILVVSAAGNFDRSDPREFPAMGQGMGVAATDHFDVKAGFSNFNDKLSISSPGATGDPFDHGQAVISTIPGGGYAAWEGTSFAAPFVAGAVALIRSQHPEWLANSGTANVIQSSIETLSVDIYPQNPMYEDDESLGAGRLDAGAVALIGPVAPTVLGDLDNDGAIGFTDLILVLGAWNEVHSSADLDGDGHVGFADLLILIGNWG